MLPLLTTPWALAALAALPALTALYWMRHSYRNVPVSSLVLWRDQSESRTSGLRLRRLQTPLLFILELIALAALALAATGPRIEIGGGAPPLIVVLDDSLSMQAGGDDSPKSRALAAIERDLGWRSAGSVRFVVAGAQPQSLGEPVSTFAEAKDALTEWRCLAPQAKIAEAIVFATELGGEGARILVVSDRPPPESAAMERIVWWAFGQASPNVAIIRALRTARDDHDICSFEIANYSPGPRNVTLAIAAGNSEAGRQNLALGPRETRRIIFRAGSDALLIEGRILEADAFDLDNRASLVRDVLPPVRVDVQIADETMQKPIEKALKATGKTLPPGVRPQLLFTDSQDVPEKTAAETWVVHVLQETDADAFLGPFVLDRTHPLTDGLGLEGVVWGAGKSQDFPGSPVLLAGNVPLVTDVRLPNGQHRLRIRLRADISTLPQSPTWPVLYWNLVQWRAKEIPGLERANLRLGDAALLSLRPDVERVQVIGPDAQSQSLPVRGQRVVVPADQVGLYSIFADDEATRFAISVVNAEESDLSQATSGRWGEWPEENNGAPGVLHLAWIVTLLALGVLTAHLFVATRVSS
jgi:hypothetical protein